jgi:uncharacterized protein (UPF0371 family)
LKPVRQLEKRPLLRRILERINGQPACHKSPTDMGVNRADFGIVDDAACRAAARQEIVRRYFIYACEYAMGLVNRDTVSRVEMLMRDLGLTPTDRVVVQPAHAAAQQAQAQGKGCEGFYCGAAIELKDGRIVTGKNSPLMHAASSLILNAVKTLAGIPDEVHLLPPLVTRSLSHFKTDVLKGKTTSLDLEETLIALSISATLNPVVEKVIGHLKELTGCEVHLSHIPSPGDAAGLRKLGVNMTSEPEFATKYLFVS